MATKKRKRTVQRVAPVQAPQKKAGAKKGWAITFLVINIFVILGGIGAILYGGAIFLMALGLSLGTITSGLILGTGLVTSFIFIASGIVAIVLGGIICGVCTRYLKSLKVAKK